MAGAPDAQRVQAAGLDDAVEVGVDEVQPGRGAPVAEQPRLDVLGAQRLGQQRVGHQVDLARRPGSWRPASGRPRPPALLHRGSWLIPGECRAFRAPLRGASGDFGTVGRYGQAAVGPDVLGSSPNGAGSVVRAESSAEPGSTTTQETAVAYRAPRLGNWRRPPAVEDPLTYLDQGEVADHHGDKRDEEAKRKRLEPEPGGQRCSEQKDSYAYNLRGRPGSKGGWGDLARTGYGGCAGWRR